MWYKGLKNKQKTKANREARKNQSGLYTIAKNIARDKEKEEKEDKYRLKKIEQAHNKAIRYGKRAAKEASRAKNLNLILYRKFSKNNLITHLNSLKLEHFFGGLG